MRGVVRIVAVAVGVVAGGFLWATPAHANTHIFVSIGPPVAPVVAAPVPVPAPVYGPYGPVYGPGPVYAPAAYGYAWQPGYYAWTGFSYRWVPGVWAPRPYRRAVWVPGVWSRSPRGYFWARGYWRR